MILTSIVAIVMSISIRINAPRLTQGLFAGYLAFLAGWGIVRGPRVLSGLVAVNNKRRKLRERRAELEREFSQLRRSRESTKSIDDGPHQTPIVYPNESDL